MAITPKQFAELLQRVQGSRPKPARLQPQGTCNPPPRREVILGIDPSLRSTGYGVVRLTKSHPVALAYGKISCPAAWAHSRCLLAINNALRNVIQLHAPEVCAIEGLFFAQNLQTALTMGQARGAALVAVAEAGLEIFELAPRRVKQAIVGHGAAQKSAVAKMVQRLLHLTDLPDADAADALAIALAHAQDTSRFSLTRGKPI